MGGILQRLTENPHDDYSPSWSPDGKRIAFVSDRDGHVHVIHGRPTSEIYVMDADGGNPQNLTNIPMMTGIPHGPPTVNGLPSRLIGMGDFQNFEIYVMDADGGNQQRLTNNPFDDGYPSWSPDGKRIVFSRLLGMGTLKTSCNHS